MKTKNIVVCLILAIICFSCCGKKERIEGNVQDVFGNSMKDVSIKIEKSTFSSTTDEYGNYSIDYVTGSIRLILSKDGYTTVNIDLNINQKSYFPAEKIILYPIPKENGIFYVDLEGKRLIKFEKNGKIEQSKMASQSFTLTTLYRYSIHFFNESLSLIPGKLTFIDTTPEQLSISSVNENGIIYVGELNMMERKDRYSGFIKESLLRVGNEKLLIRSMELSSGSYTFVEMLKNDMIGSLPKNGGAAIGFNVGGSSVNKATTPPLDSHAVDKILAPPASQAPLLPRDVTHLKFKSMEKKSAEEKCEECHSPQGQKPLSEKHPPKYRCLFCHKRGN